MRPTILAALMALSMSAGILGAGIAADSAMARPVALSDAEVAPTWLRLVQPNRAASMPLRVAYCASDVSAYRWDGAPLSAQRWIGDLVTYWSTPFGRRVTFDGVKWRNRTRVPVLVAAWC